MDWARRLLAAFHGAGGTAIGFEGLMVDEVVAARARAILDGAGVDGAGVEGADGDGSGESP